MSHILHGAINIPDSGIGTAAVPHHLILAILIYYKPQKEAAICIRPSRRWLKHLKVYLPFFDSSGPIISMYMDMTTEEDKTMAENWKADADGVLIFVRLSHLLWCFTQTQ